MMNEIDRRKLVGFLEGMDRTAQSSQRICVIGAAALILLGQPERQTGDVDIWRPGSTILDSELSQIAATVGLAYNPMEFEQEGAYLQIINPGVVNLPSVQGDIWATGEESRVLWQGAKLTVVCPPPPIIAASKLVRASDVDINDVVFLMGAVGVSKKQIVAAAGKFPDPDGQFARENIAIVDAMLTPAERRKQQKPREGDER